MLYFTRVFIVVFPLLLSSHTLFAKVKENSTGDTDGWAVLLDPSLSQWDTYLSYRFKSGYNGDKPSDDPIGLNKIQGKEVFSTQEENGETVLTITGEIYGALISKKYTETIISSSK
jgi:hypothetical protein